MKSIELAFGLSSDLACTADANAAFSAGSSYEYEPTRRPGNSQDVQPFEVELTLDRQAGGPSYRLGGWLCFRNAGLRPAALNVEQKPKLQEDVQKLHAIHEYESAAIR